MHSETGARCTLQAARARRLRGYSVEVGMEQDICDVTLWLIDKHSPSRVRVWVDRHYLPIMRGYLYARLRNGRRCAHPGELVRGKWQRKRQQPKKPGKNSEKRFCRPLPAPISRRTVPTRVDARNG